MARRSYSRSTRRYSAPRRRTGSTRARAPRSYAPRRTSSYRSARRSVSRGREIRIVIEQPGASMVARPELIGKMPAATLTRTRSRF